jgi:hypothetical protein
MQLLASAELWPLIHKLAKRGPKRAAIAYVSNDNDIKFTNGDSLVVDASDEKIKSGDTSARVLRDALNRGANLYSVPRLHAKVMLLNGTAVIGSANLSENSRNYLTEAGFITDAPAVTAMLASFIERLASKAEIIDADFITRIERLRVTKRRGASPDGRRRKVTLGSSVTWLVGTKARDEPQEEYREALSTLESEANSRRRSTANELSWMTIDDGSSIQRKIKAGDQAICIQTDGKDVRVEPPFTVLARGTKRGAALLQSEEIDTTYKPLSITQLKDLLRSVGGPTKFTKDDTLLLKDRVAEALMALWPRKARRRSRRARSS